MPERRASAPATGEEAQFLHHRRPGRPVPAWIPDTLRSFLAHAAGNDGLLFRFRLVVNVGDWLKRFMKLVIPGRVSEERAERVGNPCRNAAAA